MAQSDAEMNLLIDEVQDYIAKRLFRANRMGNLDELLEKIGFRKTKTDCHPSLQRNAKILICGDLGIQKKDLVGLIKSMGMRPEQFVFISYEDSTNFDFNKLEYSGSYSDILFGPVPHMAKGTDGYSSIISCMEAQPEKYPNVIRLQDHSEGLKISKTSFREGLMKTRLFSAPLAA